MLKGVSIYKHSNSIIFKVPMSRDVVILHFLVDSCIPNKLGNITY